MRILIICTLLMMLVIENASGQADKIRKLQQHLPEIKDSMRYVDAVNKISLLFYEQNIDSTFNYTLQARNIAKRLNYARGMADATNNLGVVFDIKGNVQLALRYYNDAYNQYRAIGDSSNIVQTLMNIGQVYGGSGKDQKAISNFDRALSMGNKLSKDSINALVIYNYMLIYPEKFADSEKDRYIDKAAKIAKKYHDVRLELALQQLKASQLIAQKKVNKGILILETTLMRTIEMQLYYLSMDLFIQLGGIHISRGDTEKGASLYKQALQFTEQKGYRMYAIDICKKLYDLYSGKGDNANAYIYTKKLVQLYEEQAEIDKVSGIDYIEYAVKEQELASEQLKSAYNSRMLWLAIAVCMLTILSIIFLTRNWILTRKTNDVLTLQFRQLESTTEALEQSNQNYARLIKIVAHDLRNPIGAVNSLSSLMLEEGLSASENREFAQLIYESSNNCIKLIGDLLETDFNFKESELHKEEISLPVFLQQAVKLLAFRANEKSQELILTEPVNVDILADRDKLLRVLNNLIVNAIKFSPPGGTIQISTSRSKEGIVISVKDNGLGIPKESAAKIFDPFTTSKRTGTAGEQPFGLGLYITKQIIEAHHGRIWFDSEPGTGTTFFVMLPQVA